MKSFTFIVRTFNGILWYDFAIASDVGSIHLFIVANSDHCSLHCTSYLSGMPGNSTVVIPVATAMRNNVATAGTFLELVVCFRHVDRVRHVLASASWATF